MIAEHRPTTARPSARVMPTARISAWTQHWSFVACLVAVYVVIGLRALSDDRYLDDEGLLTYHYAEFLRRDFTAAFFWLKSHPILALLNLPGAALGLSGFFVLHVAIGAAGLVLIAVAARRAGLRATGIAPLVMATSPLYVQGGPSGIANVDGAALASAALALSVGGRPGFAAGLVAGALPLTRFELSLLTLSVLAIAVAGGRRRRFLFGLVLVPLAYAVAGALYHGELWWFVDFPPAWGQWDPSSATVVAEGVERITVQALVRSIGLTIPALPLLLLLRRGDRAARPSFELPLLAFVGAFVAGITLLPFARVAFGFDDRYYLTALPAVALLAGRAVDSFAALGAGAGRWLRLGIAVAGVVVAGQAGAWALAVVAGAAGALVVFAAAVPAATAVAALSACLALTLVVTLPRGYRRHDDLRIATAWMRAHRTELAGVPVYTNIKLLDAFAARSGEAPGFDVATLIQPDMRKELLEWSNPRNGQRERIWRLTQQVFYGRGADPAEIIEGRAPAGAVLVLDTDDLRTDEMFPRSFLEAHTRTVATGPRLRMVVILQGRPAD